jgi:hypothetical protein
MFEMCVQATDRTALARGYRVVLPHDAHATHQVSDPERRQRVSDRVASPTPSSPIGGRVTISTELDLSRRVRVGW